MAKVFKRKWKNRKGEGSTWAFTYSDTFGKRKIESGFDTKAEAETELSKRLQEVDNGMYQEVNKSLTFAQLAEKFMNHYAKLHLEQSTYDTHETNLRVHLMPIFGKMKILDITTSTINEFIVLKKDCTNLSNATINKIVALLKNIFSNAYQDGIINRNPSLRVKKLKEAKPEQLFLTKKEVDAVLEAAKQHYPDFFPLLFCAVSTGARQGELFALTWDKINFVEDYIKIDRSVYKEKFKAPKTLSSIRKIYISDELIKILKSWRLRCPHSELNLVFPNKVGGFMDGHNMRNREFSAVLRRAGVTRVRFHDLRHTFASLLITNGANIKYVQNQLGHATTDMTLNTYSHLMPESIDEGVQIMNGIFSSKDNDVRKFGT